MIISIDEMSQKMSQKTLWAQRDTPGLVEVLTLLKRKADALLISARDTMPAGADRDGRLSESRALAQFEREIRQLIEDEGRKQVVTPELPQRGASGFC